MPKLDLTEEELAYIRAKVTSKRPPVLAARQKELRNSILQKFRTVQEGEVLQDNTRIVTLDTAWQEAFNADPNNFGNSPSSQQS